MHALVAVSNSGLYLLSYPFSYWNSNALVQIDLGNDESNQNRLSPASPSCILNRKSSNTSLLPKTAGGGRLCWHDFENLVWNIRYSKI